MLSRAKTQGADILNPMVFDRAKALRGFDIGVRDQCPFLLKFFDQDIPPFLMIIEPVGQLTESTEEFIERANQVIDESRDPSM